MRTPGGARDALANGAHGEDGEHDEDPKLRAMRAVWLEMRDEEPSDRGLASLLAAARAKAETMQVRPTLWQRLVAGLGRPPALALATVVVLVGGAVILGGRGLDSSEAIRAPGAVPGAADKMAGAPVAQPAAPVGGPGAGGDVAPVDRLARPASANERGAPEAGLVTATPDPEPAGPVTRLAKKEDPASAAAAPDVRSMKEDSAKRPAPGPAAARGGADFGERVPAADAASKEVALAGRTVAREASGKVEPAPTTPASRPGETAPAPRVTDARAADQLAAGNDGMSMSRPQHAPAPEAASKNVSRDARPAEANRPPASVADDADAPRPAPGVRRAPDAAESTKDLERVESSVETSDRSQAPPAVPLAQLYKQCESAARRGDCAAVRLMVVRITKTDRSYRARVAKDSPVAKCLAE